MWIWQRIKKKKKKTFHQINIIIMACQAAECFYFFFTLIGTNYGTQTKTFQSTERVLIWQLPGSLCRRLAKYFHDCHIPITTFYHELLWLSRFVASNHRLYHAFFLHVVVGHRAELSHVKQLKLWKMEHEWMSNKTWLKRDDGMCLLADLRHIFRIIYWHFPECNC